MPVNRTCFLYLLGVSVMVLWIQGCSQVTVQYPAVSPQQSMILPAGLQENHRQDNGKNRLWNISNQASFTADFIEYNAPLVTLRRDDKKTVKVHIQKLSAENRQYLKRLMNGTPDPPHTAEY